MDLLDAVRAFFDAMQWPNAPTEDGSSLVLRFDGENGSFPFYVTSRNDHQQLLVYALFPTDFAPERREALAMLLTRANHGMVIGNFEADLDTGEVRYKTSLDLEEAEVSLALIRNLVRANVLTMDHYFPALEALVTSDCTPEEALAGIEP